VNGEDAYPIGKKIVLSPDAMRRTKGRGENRFGKKKKISGLEGIRIPESSSEAMYVRSSIF